MSDAQLEVARRALRIIDEIVREYGDGTKGHEVMRGRLRARTLTLPNCVAEGRVNDGELDAVTTAIYATYPELLP